MLKQIDTLNEIGFKNAVKFFYTSLAMVPLRLVLFPQLRTLYLKILGSKISSHSVIHDIKFFNAYRTGFSGLSLGEKVFIGDDCLFDLADKITLENNVTLAERVTILTHTNVGYKDHPLQKYFPSSAASVVVKSGSFIGVNATIMPGITIGEGACIGACSLVLEDVPPWHVVAGVPAKIIRKLQ